MGIFGWSYPPGAAGDPYAPYNQDDGPCAVCCKPVDDCICPECPTCHSHGDPKCYREHGLQLSREQVIARQKMRLARAQERLTDEHMELSSLENGGDFSPDIEDNLDPWS